LATDGNRKYDTNDGTPHKKSPTGNSCRASIWFLYFKISTHDFSSAGNFPVTSFFLFDIFNLVIHARKTNEKEY